MLTARVLEAVIHSRASAWRARRVLCPSCDQQVGLNVVLDRDERPRRDVLEVVHAGWRSWLAWAARQLPRPGISAPQRRWRSVQRANARRSKSVPVAMIFNKAELPLTTL